MAKVGHTDVDPVLFCCNDDCYVEELQPDRLAAMSGANRQDGFTNRGPRGKRPLTIEPHSAGSQLSSPLFHRLSGELRSLIYCFVFPLQTVHVLLRACPYNDKWTRVQNYQHEYWTDDDDADDYPYQRLESRTMRSYMKTASHACSFPHDWERQYALSNRPEAIPRHYLNKNGRLSQFGRPCPEAVSSPFKLHGLCGARPQQRKDIREFKCEDVRLGLSLLHACRRIYLETWFLPFANFTFEFMPPHPGVPQDFLTAMLYEHQARAIERIHLHNMRKWSDYGGVEGVFHHLPGLKHLRVSFEHGDGLEGFKEDWEKVCKPKDLQTVEVVVGHDYDPQQGTRLVRRKRAVAAERLLLGEQSLQKRRLVDAASEGEDCFQLESNVLIAPKDATDFWTD